MSDTKSSLKNKRDVQAGLIALRKRLPALENIFDAFGPLLEAQQKSFELLEKWDGYELPEAYAPRFEQGVPLLAEMKMPDLGSFYADIFWITAEALADGLPATEDNISVITEQMKDSFELNELSKIIWEEDGVRLEELVKDCKVDQDTLVFIATMALKPFMMRMEKKATESIEKMQWLKGYCPICGTFPDMSLLKKSGEDNAYLKSHGGQRWMHCSCCGHEWRFKRNMCPWCESEDYDKLRYMQSDERQNERIDLCDSCKHYFVTVDTRELIEEPDLRVAPLGLVHLDIRAQEEEYIPMAETPWNTL